MALRNVVNVKAKDLLSVECLDAKKDGINSKRKIHPKQNTLQLSSIVQNVKARKERLALNATQHARESVRIAVVRALHIRRDKFEMETPPNIPNLKFEKVIGRGGMSVVWLAWHEGLKKNVAVKVLNKEAAQSGLDIRQFMQETRIMTELSHPNIVKGYESDCTEDGRYYFVMEYVDGYTFNEFIEKKTVLPEADALIITQAVADALEYAWQTMKIIHCDIKPDNIMVNSNGDIKLADFGLCEIYSEAQTHTTVKEEILGTPAYMSPEQIVATEKLDFRTDIYSLGATLYHLVTKRTLFPIEDNDLILRSHVEDEFQAADPRVFNRTISSGFVSLIEMMLKKNRDDRYKSWLYVSSDVKKIESTGMLPGYAASGVSSIRTLS